MCSEGSEAWCFGIHSTRHISSKRQVESGKDWVWKWMWDRGHRRPHESFSI